MSVKVRIPTQLRPLAGGAGEVEVEGGTVGDALKALDVAHPGSRAPLRRRWQPQALRQRLHGRRGHPLPLGPGHPGARGLGGVRRAGSGRRLSDASAAAARAARFSRSGRQLARECPVTLYC